MPKKIINIFKILVDKVRFSTFFTFVNVMQSDTERRQIDRIF